MRISIIYKVFRKREAFYHWKNQIQLVATAEHFNEVDGPVNVDCFNLKQLCLNLISMLKTDGIKDEEIL
jgi:hypothetical protein